MALHGGATPRQNSRTMILNVRTWHRLVLASVLVFALSFVCWFLPEGTIKEAVILFGTGFTMFTAALGVVMAVLLVIGRLKMGCPQCGRASKASFGGDNTLCLECPECGELFVSFGRMGPLKILGEDSADEAEDDPSEWEENQKDGAGFKRLMMTPRRHPVAFTLIYAPVVASVVAASIIHEFIIIYVIVPGFWCYAIGAMLVEAIQRGRIADNQGSAVRSKQPFRFWLKAGIWILAYLFATWVPIGLALQESGKEAVKSEKKALPR